MKAEIYVKVYVLMAIFIFNIILVAFNSILINLMSCLCVYLCLILAVSVLHVQWYHSYKN